MFNAKQVEQLLKPIHPSRVLADGKGHAHVSQQDVMAHLIRVFGFGNFDIDVLDSALIFERERTDRTSGKPTGRFDVCYRGMVRLTVRGPDGGQCHFENGSTATAQNQSLGDGHDLAFKSAISLAVKRAAIALGDQFGLSLYNKGQRSALVMTTLVKPAGDVAGVDVQAGVPQQVSLGNDEVEHPSDAEAMGRGSQQRRTGSVSAADIITPAPAAEVTVVDVDTFVDAIAEVTDVAQLRQMFKETDQFGDQAGDVKALLTARAEQLSKPAPVSEDAQMDAALEAEIVEAGA